MSSRGDSTTQVLRARWVFPVCGPPLERATLTVQGDAIRAVNGEERTDLALDNAAILPGLVNAHTHLDLSGLRGRAPPSPDFTGWLRQLIAHRRSRTPEQTRQDVQAGLSECLRFGTTLVGDISGDGTSWDVLRDAPLRAVVYRELLGLTKERAESALIAARAWLEMHPGTETCHPALSPHAPYSVRADLFARAALLAREYRCPLAIHLAESLAELDLLHHHRGPFVPFLKELDVWDAAGLASTPSMVMKVCNQHIPKLFIHGNHLAPSSRIPRRSTIIYCPRTHAAFGPPPHPFRDFLARGVRVALGTDSLASNPDLDLLAEARFLHRLYPDLPGDVLLRMATLSGAEALDWADQTGSLDPGKSADLVVLPLPDRDVADPHHLLFDSSLPIRAVMWRGRWLFDREGILSSSLRA